MKRIFTLLILLCSIFVSAQWTSNTMTNTPVTTAVNDQYNAKTLSDGAGGVFVAWQDDRVNNFSIYAQKMNANGVAQWTANGLTVCNATFDQINPFLLPDGLGGIFIVWTDYRINTLYQTYAQHIDASGNILWQANGKEVTSGFQCLDLNAISDGAGGFYVTYRDTHLPDRLWGQHLDASGNPLWGATDLNISGNATSSSQNGKMILDSSGGLIVAWQKGLDIYAQRISSNGTIQWTAGGVAVETGPSSENDAQIVTDGSGGAFIIWRTYNSNYTYSFQKINSAGALQWATRKTIMDTYASDLSILEDGSGGFISAWTDHRLELASDANVRVYTQRFDNNGTPIWSENGITVKNGTAIRPQSGCTLFRNGDGYIYYFFKDSYRNQNNVWFSFLYAQKLSFSGALLWNPNGVTVCNYPYTFLRDITVVPHNDSGDMIVTFANDRVNADFDVFVQLVHPTGLLDVNSPEQEKSFGIYPNPTTGLFSIDSNVAVDRIIVFDVLGKEVMRVEPSSRHPQLQMAARAKGVYLVKLISGENETVKKLILN